MLQRPALPVRSRLDVDVTLEPSRVDGPRVVVVQVEPEMKELL